MNRTIFFILVIGYIIRLIGLNQSLWLDEGTTVRVVHDYNFTQILTLFSPFDFHPPLYYFFMKVWTTLFGYSEVSLRMPSVLFAVATGYIIYLTLKGKKGLIATSLFLFNPLVMYYSQEARMYMMVTFLLTFALYQLLLLLGSDMTKFSIFNFQFLFKIRNLKFKIKKHKIYVVIFNIVSFLAFCTFYGSIFMIMSFYLYLCWKRKFKLLFMLLPGFILSVIVLSPLLSKQLAHSRESLQLVANWRSVLGTVNIKNLLLIPLKFAFGRISFEPKKIYYLVAAGWTVFIFGLLIKGAYRKKEVLFLFFTPLFLGLTFSLFSPLLQYFRFLYLLPLLAILLSYSIDSFSGKYKDILAAATITGFGVLSFTYLLLPQFHRENWQRLGTETREVKKIYAIPSSMDAFTYYNPSSRIVDLRTISNTKPQEKEIAVIPYTAEIYSYDYKGLLRQASYNLTQSKEYRGVTLEYWQHE